MKKLGFILFGFISFFYSHNLSGQDTLNLNDLKKFSYPFSLENGKFEGLGGEVLIKAIEEAHITMLGDDTRSKLESEFTEALIDELDHNHYKTMVVETGNASGKVIHQLSKSEEQFISNIKALNQKYGIGQKENPLVPIPDFKTLEATKFLQSALQKDWSIIGIGTEAWTSYKMLVDELYNNLSKEQQKENVASYEATIKLLDTQYTTISRQGQSGVFAFTSALKASQEFNDFIATMNTFSQNKATVEALRFSLDFWWMYGNKEFHKKNNLQAKRNKLSLARTLDSQKFDFKKDKLFIKMFVNHLARGTTVSGFYGVGNMLHEMTEYQGNTSLSIALTRRFYNSDGAIKDVIDSEGFKYNSFKELVPLGKKEEWVLIDLRPFNKEFYFEGVHMNTEMHKIITRYDMIVIPKTDLKGTTLN